MVTHCVDRRSGLALRAVSLPGVVMAVLGIPINPMAIVLAVVLAGVVFILYRAQRDNGRNSFDVWDMVMDRMPDGTRRTSGIKTAYQIAFLLSSWVVVDNELKHTLTEGIFGLYLGAWCAPLIAKVVFNKADMPTIPEVK